MVLEERKRRLMRDESGREGLLALEASACVYDLGFDSCN